MQITEFEYYIFIYNYYKFKYIYKQATQQQQ